MKLKYLEKPCPSATLSIIKVSADKHESRSEVRLFLSKWAISASRTKGSTHLKPNYFIGLIYDCSIMILTQNSSVIKLHLVDQIWFVSHSLPVCKLDKLMSFSKSLRHTTISITDRLNVFHTRDFYYIEVNISHNSS